MSPEVKAHTSRMRGALLIKYKKIIKENIKCVDRAYTCSNSMTTTIIKSKMVVKLNRIRAKEYCNSLK